jgi:sporulation protein YlmC with PRC-barrel domain
VKRRILLSLLVIAAVMPVSRSTFAANEVYTESQLLGVKIVNHDDHILGEVQSINIDSLTGKIISITMKPASENSNEGSSNGRLGNPMFQDRDKNVGGK